MSSVSSVSNALAVLTATGGPLTNTSSSFQSLLGSASSSDLADISDEALALQQTQTLYGTSSEDLSSTSASSEQSLVSAAYGLVSSSTSSSTSLISTLASIYTASSATTTSGSTVSVSG